MCRDVSKKMTSRNYCFTAWKKPELEKLKKEHIKYLCFGIEKAPTTGKIHYQGYIEVKTPMRISGIKNMMCDNSVHLEKRMGTRDQAIDYCKKDGDFHILIECPGKKSVTQGIETNCVACHTDYCTILKEKFGLSEKQVNAAFYDSIAF